MSTLYSDIDVKEIVEQEGLEYAVRHYMGPENIKNKELKTLWKEAADKLNAIAAYLHLDS